MHHTVDGVDDDAGDDDDDLERGLVDEDGDGPHLPVLLNLKGIHNHMRVVFEEMSSWTPITMYSGMKTTF